MVNGRSVVRVDALDKALGRAKFTEDLVPQGTLIAKVVHSTIANGLVLSVDTEAAEAMQGVVKVLTCFDVPDIQFATAGHPWSLDPNTRDVADRKLLNKRVRHYGDCVAVVIAEDERTADNAASAVNIKYREYPVVLEPEEAVKSGAVRIHDEYPGNILKRTFVEAGDWDAVTSVKNCLCFSSVYETQATQHCHIENQCSFAWMEKGRVVIVAATQIPHILRCIIASAIGLPIGQVRVIKPHVGGGFGNKQDAVYEPLNAWLTTQVGGRCVALILDREETFHSSRTRHAIKFILESYVDKGGHILARRSKAISNQGGYASHGHTIVNNATGAYRCLYHQAALKQESVTVYTNLSSGGAMRGYGVPQANFAMESHIDDLAQRLGMDPIAFRRINMMRVGDIDAQTGIICHSSGLSECIDTGAKYMEWDKKRQLYKNQNGQRRRGIGMAIFSYKSGAWPSALETASARVTLTQDGSFMVEMGATEIGQGADTVFSQMAADVLCVPLESVHVITVQDTDTSPYDNGAYASRQTYVSGAALKKTCLQLKKNILTYTAKILHREVEELGISNNAIKDRVTGEELLSIEEVAMRSFYDRECSGRITAEESFHCNSNSYSLGCCFAEIEVDIPMGRIEILNIINVHDSGKIINPALAAAQVHGGMVMGIGYAISERMQYGSDGQLLNGNFLDYKMPTSMDVPNLKALFVEVDDPTGPFGNKSLGEPPSIPVAAAIRNALLCATGVAINSLPLNPQKLVAAFEKAGLIKETSY